MGSSQRLPQIMHAWERMRNFIILKKKAGLRVNYIYIMFKGARKSAFLSDLQQQPCK